jgi:hypothetical protein
LVWSLFFATGIQRFCQTLRIFVVTGLGGDWAELGGSFGFRYRLDGVQEGEKRGLAETIGRVVGVEKVLSIRGVSRKSAGIHISGKVCSSIEVGAVFL